MEAEANRSGRLARVFAATVLLVVSVACTSTLDHEVLESGIQEWAEDLSEDLSGQRESVTVTCPDDARAEAGYRFICEMSDGVDTVNVRVTVLNEEGDVEWEVLG
jgi:hypothetical protein